MSTMKDRRKNLRIRHIGHADEKANLIVQLARLKAMNASQEQKTYILSKTAYAAALAAVNAERGTLGLFAPPPMAVLELEAREIADRRGVREQWSAILGDLMFGCSRQTASVLSGTGRDRRKVSGPRGADQSARSQEPPRRMGQGKRAEGLGRGTVCAD